MSASPNRDDELLETWTLYDNPKDMPGYFVLRRFVVTKEGAVLASPEAYWCRDAEPLRAEMRKRGLCCMGRSHSDEPPIVETWL